MTTPVFPRDGAVDDVEGAAAEPPTILDLTAGPARITPVWTPDEGVQYSIELPDGPLSPDDAECLAIGLHTTQSGGAVLVDIEEYARPD